MCSFIDVSSDCVTVNKLSEILFSITDYMYVALENPAIALDNYKILAQEARD